MQLLGVWAVHLLGVTLPGVLCGQPLGAQLRGVQDMQTTDVQSLGGELLSVQVLGGQLLGALDVQAIDVKPLGVQCVYRSVCSWWACGHSARVERGTPGG